MKTSIFSLFFILSTIANSDASFLLVKNMTPEGDSAYSIFDEQGALIPGSMTDNIRIGYFTAGYNAQTAWANGDLAGLDSNFHRVGPLWGMYDAPGNDGLFEIDMTLGETDQYSAFNVVLWISNGTDFADIAAQHLIYEFSITFPDGTDLFLSREAILGIDTGDLIAGGWGNYSHDYGLGPVLPGFNLASIPEPSTWLLLGIAGAGFAAARRRRSF